MVSNVILSIMLLELSHKCSYEYYNNMTILTYFVTSRWYAKVLKANFRPKHGIQTLPNLLQSLVFLKTLVTDAQYTTESPKLIT